MPPPPPPAPPAAAARTDAAQPSALLKSIQKGARLRKVETIDKSAPVIEDKSSKSTSSRSIVENRPNISAGPGLFAGGMPKLKPAQSQARPAIPLPMNSSQPAPSAPYVPATSFYQPHVPAPQAAAAPEPPKRQAKAPPIPAGRPPKPAVSRDEEFDGRWTWRIDIPLPRLFNAAESRRASKPPAPMPSRTGSAGTLR